MTQRPTREIRAVFDDATIRVYQAYRDEIADAALKHGTFVSPPFSMTRMTWIKPSFLWMMYRAGWGRKEGQTRVLGIDIARDGFEWALANSSLSHERTTDTSPPVRIQWDPERDLHHNALDHRSIQIGLSRIAVQSYVRDWIGKIEDITPLAHAMQALVAAGELEEARALHPAERPYPVDPALQDHLEMID